MTLIEEIYDSSKLQYFDKELISFTPNDIFLDCGSYIGDTIENYKDISSNSFNKIYAFEADEENFDILKDKYSDDKRIEPIKCGLYDTVGKLMFNAIGSGSGEISERGSVEIGTDTIDHILQGESADFIKMDIEGSEYNAIIGARKTIERYMPTMMISVYHKRDDFIRIPLLIQSICPMYKLFFRHYRKMSVQETVCYAIARNRLAL